MRRALASAFVICAVFAQAPDAIRYVDVALHAGLKDIFYCGGEKTKDYIVETLGSGVAFIDYDNDGNLDIFAVNGSRLEAFPKGQEPTNHLYHNDGRGVQGLHYDAYTALAEAEGERIIEEACAKFAILDACCVHRIGDLAIGELAVWVGVTAAHRDPAFAACRFIIDEVKSRVPIWKHERYVAGDAGWLHPRREDTR